MSSLDPLAPFFTHFTLSARVFYSGQLCGVSGNHETPTAGHLHVVRRGILQVTQPGGRKFAVREPSVLFYPRPHKHRFRADVRDGAEIVCATVEFGATLLNTLTLALPDVLVVPLAAHRELSATVDLLFAEAFEERAGRQIAVDRLAEYLLLLLLRHAIRERTVTGGVAAGLCDRNLAAAILAMHENPEDNWTLEGLARKAGMSRARFAVRFREVVGQPPFDYLTTWRIGVAQTRLLRGEPLKIVAPYVGYASSAALTRAFVQKLGITPTTWLASL